MKGFDENSFDAICTDPPYGLEFMGKDWDKLNFHNSPAPNAKYPKSRNVRGVKLGLDVRQPGDPNYKMNDTPSGRSKVRYSSAPSYGGSASQEMQLWHYQWAVEALRVVKPGGYLLAFGGTRTFHRLACAIEDAGFEFRDTIMWVYGSGFPKSLDVSKMIDKMKGVEREVVGYKPYTQQDIRGGGYDSEKAQLKERLPSEITLPVSEEAKEWEGWGTALKPAWEPILVFRKPVVGTVAENVLKYGTGAMNIDECRIKSNEDCSRKRSLVRDTVAPFGKGYEMGGDGSPLGRWPANLVHDGSEEVIDEFEQYGEKKSGVMRAGTLRSTDGGYHGDFPETACLHDTYGDSGSISRFFYCAKADKGERDLGLEQEEGEFMDEGREEGSPGGTNPRNRGAQTARKNFHPCLTPDSLIMTSLGYIPISELTLKNKVLSEDGKFHKIIDISSHDYSEDIYELSVNGTNLKIKATHNHPFLVYQPIRKGNSIIGGETSFVESSSLKTGDYILSSIPEIIQAENLGGDKWFVVGLWLAEGSFIKAGHGKNKYPVFSLHKREKNLIERIQSFFGQEKVKTYKHGENGILVYVTDPKFAIELKNLCNEGAKSKVLCKKIWSLPINCLQSLFDGYIAGDGGKVRNYLQSKSASIQLSSQLKIIGQMLGYRTNLWGYLTKSNAGIKNRRFKTFGINYTNQFHPLNKSRKHKARPLELVYQGKRFSLSRIKSIEHYSYGGKVWNLTINGNPTFETAIGISHNTVKPVELMKWLINLVSRENSLILDPFVGSGSTLVACKKLGRKVVGIEKDEGYCKITQKRLKAPLQKTFF
jgi:site-specific DNA-methyltransferase (adenine-specific)